jgi:hypothetical protein
VQAVEQHGGDPRDLGAVVVLGHHEEVGLPAGGEQQGSSRPGEPPVPLEEWVAVRRQQAVEGEGVRHVGREVRQRADGAVLRRHGQQVPERAHVARPHEHQHPVVLVADEARHVVRDSYVPGVPLFEHVRSAVVGALTGHEMAVHDPVGLACERVFGVQPADVVRNRAPGEAGIVRRRAAVSHFNHPGVPLRDLGVTCVERADGVVPDAHGRIHGVHAVVPEQAGQAESHLLPLIRREREAAAEVGLVPLVERGLFRHVRLERDLGRPHPGQAPDERLQLRLASWAEDVGGGIPVGIAGGTRHVIRTGEDDLGLARGTDRPARRWRIPSPLRA